MKDLGWGTGLAIGHPLPPKHREGKCAYHRTYKVRNKPGTPCERCWELWRMRQAKEAEEGEGA